MLHLKRVGFILLLVFFCLSKAAPSVRLDGFTLDDVLSGRFSAVGFNGTWISDKEFSYRTAAGGLSIFNVETQQETVVATPELLQPLGGSSYQLSSDRNYLLYRKDTVALWRYSSHARYFILNLATGESYPLQPQAGSPQPLLRYARWNSGATSLIYVYENDIYYRSTPSATADVRLTDTGRTELIFNGVPDWVYEEEMLYSTNAIWVAGDGRRMVFASFNDTLVDMFSFSKYGAPSTKQNQYSQTVSIRYPKPGRPNPVVSLHLADLTSTTVSPGVLAPPAELASQDHYLALVDWPTNDEIFVGWLNRHQNVLFYSFCNAATLACNTEFVLNETAGWIEADTAAPYFSGDGTKYLMISPQPQEPADILGNFKHLVIRDRASNQITRLTQGLWEVTSILAWDEVGQFAYVVGTAVDAPSARHVYKVNTASANDFSCVTCGAVNADGFECTSNGGGFSSGLTYWVHSCSGPDVPRSVIKETATGTEVFLVSDNRDLKSRLDQKALPVPFNLQVPVTGGYNADVRLILPPSFDWNSGVKYPVLVYVYGGPNSQQISDRFSVNWGTHLASSRGVIYALIDGRGSGYKGDKMLHEIYRRLGTVEIEDQIAVTKYLIQNLNFIDGDRTAIWGWSYGGYATATTLARDTEGVFKCGMSVAPVTNWIYYDTIYTERYMGLPTPQDNEAAYNNSDISRIVENIRNKKFYLIHGTADDNVHYQQSMMLSQSLESLDILFRQQSYPDENHGIGRFSKHLYHSLGTFLMTDCFQLENEVWG